MKCKALSVGFLLSSLAACGGSSSGSAVNPVSPPPNNSSSATVIETFDDGSGVARTQTTTDGVTVVLNAMGPDIQSAVNAINSGQSGDVNFTNETFVESNAYGDFFTADFLVNGEPVSVVLYLDANDIVTIAYGESADSNFLITGGERVTNIPSGTFTYAGTNVIGNRDGSYAEQGTFSMNVDFNARQASISGSTPSSTISGTNIAVNNSNGTFSSNAIVLGIDGVPYQGTINGNFHGNGAVGVTGIYHENAGNPVVAGAIAGTR